MLHAIAASGHLAALTPIDTVAIDQPPVWKAALIGSLLLLGVLSVIDRILPRFQKWDNNIAVVIAIFGVAGSLALTPRFTNMRISLRDIFTEALGSTGTGQAGMVIVTVIIIALGIIVYRSRANFLTLCLLVVTSSSIYFIEAVVQVAVWWLQPAVLVFRFFWTLITAIGGTG